MESIIESVEHDIEEHKRSLDSPEFEHYRDEFFDEDTKISELIMMADFMNIDFDIGFEQGYIRGMEEVLRKLKELN